MPVAPQPLGHCKNHECKSPHCPTKHYATCILAFLYSCLMPHPSGSKLLTNPHVIPHPTPCWGWWGVTMIGALLWVCFCFTQQLLTEVPDSHLLLLQYHQYWTHYSQGSRYLNNLFSYFNRVHLQKYRAPDSLDYHVPGITLAPPTPANPDDPVEIRNVSPVSKVKQEIQCYVLTSDGARCVEKKHVR